MSTYINGTTMMETDEGLNDSGCNTGLNSRESSFGSLNGNSHTNGMGNSSIHQTSNGHHQNGTGGMIVTATIGTSSPRPRRRGGSRPGSRPGSWAGSGVSVTQEVQPGQGQGHVDTTSATLLRPASGHEGNSVQANYSVQSHHNTNGNVLGQVSVGQGKEGVDQTPGQKVPVKQECNGSVKGPHEYNHRPHSGPQQNHTQQPKPEPETMDIPVKIFETGRTKTFTLPASTTVDDLLRDIKKEEPQYKDIPNDQMRLQQAGRNLQTGMKLNRCEIKDKGPVHLTGRLRGG